MSRNALSQRYQNRFKRVVDHIYAHLDAELTLQHLADVAHMSPFHFHRIYQGVYGESIIATVKRLRLHRAAGLLVYTTDAVDEIAKRSGYQNLQSFTRIFRAAYGMPPGRYRQYGSHKQFSLSPVSESTAMYSVTIKQQPAITLAGIDHQGSYMEIGKAFEALIGTLAMQNRLDTRIRMMAIYFDDPSIVEEAQLRSRAVIAVNDDEQVDGLVHQSFAAGEYAVLQYKGPYPDMAAAYQWLFGVWLPESGRDAADQPCIEEYLNNPRETPPTELLTDIWLPLKPMD